MVVVTYDKLPPLTIGPHERVFVLTGAGISAESGISTFRDKDGLWERHRIEDVASPGGWHADAGVVWRFYSERRAQAETVLPNAAHVALAELEQRLENRLFLCTQNVDPLHERAGSRRVLHMHGELFKTRCENAYCSTSPREDHGVYMTKEEIPRCGECDARLRPHICWFGEMPFDMDRIARELARCDWFITIGSSGAVYPAAGFVEEVRSHGRARKIYVGPERPDNAAHFDECRLGRAGEVVPVLFSV
ncbi:NAD-dependent deacylase [Pendulispora albinea]|uniref:NAD-dependent protein deacylase n=1 Tax=Pendulispora albinea TaxID=2741071 RepID=A0ABZ2M5Q6_9BACT